jgi:hypothetical protein
VAKNRWELAAEQLEEQQRQENLRAATPRRMAVVVGAVILLLLSWAGLSYWRTAPLREPNLPRAEATVLQDLPKSGVMVEYRLPDGRVYWDRFKLAGRWERGDTVPIRYVPDDPGQARPLGPKYTPAWQPLLIIAGILTLALPGLVGLAAWRQRKEREAVASSEDVEATQPKASRT